MLFRSGATISGLTNAIGLTSTHLNITSNSAIQGTANMVVWKVDELTIAQGVKFDLNNCWIEIDVTAQENMGCEKIHGVATSQYLTDPTAKIGNGKIVAKDVNGEYLQWNLGTQKWIALN